MPTKPQDSYPHTDIPAYYYEKYVESIRQHIDLEIKKLEDTIRSLKSRRNVLAPISRLPPEILSQIFVFCASGFAPSWKSLDWINVSHVCRRWRATAIDCPSLWSNIVATRPKWTEEMLRRSKMTSLVLKADLSHMPPKVLEAVQSTLQHIARIKDLRISANVHTFEKFLANFPVDAPLLQTLALTISWDQFGMDESFDLPKKIFSGDVSRLQRLELDRFSIVWNSPMFVGLKVLKICHTPLLKRPTISQLMDVLEKMPALKVLHFWEALPLVADDVVLTEPANRIVNLSHLRHINIISTVPECTNLLNHITFPCDVIYSFKTQGTMATGHDFSTIFNAISNYEISIRTLHILFDYPALTIQGWSDCRRLPLTIPHIKLSLSWQEYDAGAAESILTAACKVLSLSHLESLYLVHIDSIKPKTWVTLFGSLPKIQFVYLTGGSAYTFVSALRQRPISGRKTQSTPSRKKPSSHKPESKIPPIYFPNLQILTMNDVYFSMECFNQLRDCLMERSEQRVGLQELRFVSCTHLMEDDVNSLSEIVDVEWDCIERGSSVMDERESMYAADFTDYFDEYDDYEDF